jgi:hypothetical protein
MAEAMREIPPNETEMRTPEAANDTEQPQSGTFAIKAERLAERTQEAGVSDAAAIKDAETAIAKMGFEKLSDTNIEGSADDNTKLEQEIALLQEQLHQLPPKSFLGRLNGNNRTVDHLNTLIEEKQQLALENKSLENMTEDQRAERRRANTIRSIR